MKYIFISTVLIGCLLLYGCNDGDEASNDTEGNPMTTTATQEISSEASSTDKTTNSEIITYANKEATTASQGVMSELPVSTDEEDIAIVGEPTAAPDQKQAAETETSECATTVTYDSETSGVDNGNIMPDDGMTWSSLQPVN